MQPRSCNEIMATKCNMMAAGGCMIFKFYGQHAGQKLNAPGMRIDASLCSFHLQSDRTDSLADSVACDTRNLLWSGIGDG